MQWISVKERLPERDPNARYSEVPCLVCHKGEIKILVFNHEHMCWDDADGDDFYCKTMEVSHWMELPPPPQFDEAPLTKDELVRRQKDVAQYNVDAAEQRAFDEAEWPDPEKGESV
jgi:hypothetical protein